MKQFFTIRWIALIIFVPFFFSSCEKEDKPTPTNQLMEGVWKVVEVRDINDSNVTAKVNALLVPNLIQLNSTNGVNSTSGLCLCILFMEIRNYECSKPA